MSDSDNNGPWQVKSVRRAYDNAWLSVDHHDVTQPDGSPGIYGVIRFKNVAVGVLPLFSDGTVPIVGQHRFPLNAYSWEVPEGGGPLNEPPIEAARRELSEETGYTARHWVELAAFDVSNSVTDERSVCFLAWGLSAGEVSPEPSEQFDHDRVAFPDLMEMCLDGRVRDGLTIMMVLTAHARAIRGEFPKPICALLQHAK